MEYCKNFLRAPVDQWFCWKTENRLDNKVENFMYIGNFSLEEYILPFLAFGEILDKVLEV